MAKDGFSAAASTTSAPAAASQRQAAVSSSSAPRSRHAAPPRTQSTAGRSLWKPPIPTASVTGQRPANTIARCGERPRRRASHHTRASIAIAHAPTTTFQAQKATGSGSSASGSESSVNSGPYGLGRWCQLESVNARSCGPAIGACT